MEVPALLGGCEEETELGPIGGGRGQQAGLPAAGGPAHLSLCAGSAPAWTASRRTSCAWR